MTAGTIHILRPLMETPARECIAVTVTLRFSDSIASIGAAARSSGESTIIITYEIVRTLLGLLLLTVCLHAGLAVIEALGAPSSSRRRRIAWVRAPCWPGCGR